MVYITSPSTCLHQVNQALYIPIPVPGSTFVHVCISWQKSTNSLLLHRWRSVTTWCRVASTLLRRTCLSLVCWTTSSVLSVQVSHLTIHKCGSVRSIRVALLLHAYLLPSSTTVALLMYGTDADADWDVGHPNGKPQFWWDLSVHLFIWGSSVPAVSNNAGKYYKKTVLGIQYSTPPRHYFTDLCCSSWSTDTKASCGWWRQILLQLYCHIQHMYDMAIVGFQQGSCINVQKLLSCELTGVLQ